MVPPLSSTRQPTRAVGPPAHFGPPAHRRPLAPWSEVPRADAPHFPADAMSSFPLLDDAPLPQTELRLPDLAAILRAPARRIRAAAIAQWIGIGLGALVALWLIFGGGPAPVRQVNDAPAWKPPAAANDGGPPPAWSAPSPAKKAPDAAAPPGQPGVPAHAQQPTADPLPPDLPDWDEAAKAASPAAVGGPVARTAQREIPPASPPAGASLNSAPAASAPQAPPAVEAPPLGITVPVPQ